MPGRQRLSVLMHKIIDGLDHYTYDDELGVLRHHGVIIMCNGFCLEQMENYYEIDDSKEHLIVKAELRNFKFYYWAHCKQKSRDMSFFIRFNRTKRDLHFGYYANNRFYESNRFSKYHAEINDFTVFYDNQLNELSRIPYSRYGLFKIPNYDTFENFMIINYSFVLYGQNLTCDNKYIYMGNTKIALVKKINIGLFDADRAPILMANNITPINFLTLDQCRSQIPIDDINYIPFNIFGEYYGRTTGKWVKLKEKTITTTILTPC